MAVSLSELLKKMLEMNGSDLHITTNSPPQIRVDGTLRPLDMPPFMAAETKQLAYSVLTDAQKHRFEENLELDFTKLKAILGLPQELSLPLDEIMAHRTPASMDRHLSPLARQNLEQWYVRDYIFYHECKKLYEQRFA